MVQIGIKILGVRLEDLAVERGATSRQNTLYRYRIDKGAWRKTEEPQFHLPEGAKTCSIRTSRDAGLHWGRPLTLSFGDGPQVVRIER